MRRPGVPRGEVIDAGRDAVSILGEAVDPV